MESSNSPQYVELAVDIVSAYVSHNSVSASDLPQLIREIHDTLVHLSASASTSSGTGLTPAVPVEESVFDDFIVCLEDGKQFKSLRRHLRSRYNMSPEEYREKWRLPPDYPMVAPRNCIRDKP
ncbi:MAG: MucR family transcriptional regulator [Beijerinckiaceae bacterium]